MTADLSPTPQEEARYAELQLHALDFARHGDTADLAPMLEAGLPVNLCDPKGNSLLMLAAYNGHPETVRLLLTQGSELDRRNDRGQTPLGGVAFKGETQIARLLLEAGAEVDADQGSGQTPLMFAAMFGRREIEELLRHAGANAHTKNRYGLTARHLRPFGILLKPLLTRLKRAKKPRTPPENPA